MMMIGINGLLYDPGKVSYGDKYEGGKMPMNRRKRRSS